MCDFVSGNADRFLSISLLDESKYVKKLLIMTSDFISVNADKFSVFYMKLNRFEVQDIC